MSNISVALQITALGMGLVFAAIILLWWMMAALTSFMADTSDSAEDTSVTPNPSPTEGPTGMLRNDEQKARAAAVAVAMALAEQQASGARPLSIPPTAIVSAWQLGMRSRQLYQKGRPIVRNPRKVG
jgi:Na+-transporting methylmalonyl-CoA/oxaloacetate decarboxylase gamma subunit